MTISETSRSLETKKEIVRNNALRILDESEAYNCAHNIISKIWVNGQIIETPMREIRLLNEKIVEKHFGLDLLIKEPCGGDYSPYEYYIGNGIVIRACVKIGSSPDTIAVFSGTNPAIIIPDIETGWNDEKKKAIENAVRTACQKPGMYEWCEGQLGEKWSVKM